MKHHLFGIAGIGIGVLITIAAIAASRPVEEPPKDLKLCLKQSDVLRQGVDYYHEQAGNMFKRFEACEQERIAAKPTAMPTAGEPTIGR
jgi:hypothetical protein